MAELVVAGQKIASICYVRRTPGAAIRVVDAAGSCQARLPTKGNPEPRLRAHVARRLVSLTQWLAELAGDVGPGPPEPSRTPAGGVFALAKYTATRAGLGPDSAGRTKSRSLSAAGGRLARWADPTDLEAVPSTVCGTQEVSLKRKLKKRYGLDRLGWKTVE